MKILHFISQGQVPSREMLIIDSLRLGRGIEFNHGNGMFAGIAFNTERMMDYSDNSAWFVDFRATFDSPSTFMYLSTYNKKAFIVDEKFQFPSGQGRLLTLDEVFFLCHLSEFKIPEINERILDCFIKSAYCNNKSINGELKKLVNDFPVFNEKAETLFPIVKELLF
jgi:hypothetical protein